MGRRKFEPIEIDLQPGELRVISVGYSPSAWTIYSPTAPWTSGYVGAMPGTTVLAGANFKLLPQSKIIIPARGSQLALLSQATVALHMVIEVA